jgi:uncharacterized protein YciI
LGELQAIWHHQLDVLIYDWANHGTQTIYRGTQTRYKHPPIRRLNIMWYAIIATDIENSLEKRIQARPAHLERLQALQSAGRLLVAGPFPAIDSVDPGPAGYSGSLIIAEFESVEEATSWAQQDPFVIEHVYASVEVKPFRKTLP